MSDSPSIRTPIVLLSVALGAALVMIAFLLGRESARQPAPVEASVPTPPTLEPESASSPDSTEERRWPKWADLGEWDVAEEPSTVAATPVAEPAAERIERRPDGTVLLSNRANETDTAPASKASPADEGASAVSAYFVRMDVIRSESGAGDPNAFAMDLIKAAMGGSTAGFDQLIADTERMEHEARQVSPPPSCQSYHEANLAALAESRAVLEEMKTAIVRFDIGGLTSIAQQAHTLQAKAKALQDMREQISADATR